MSMRLGKIYSTSILASQDHLFHDININTPLTISIEHCFKRRLYCRYHCIVKSLLRKFTLAITPLYLLTSKSFVVVAATTTSSFTSMSQTIDKISNCNTIHQGVSYIDAATAKAIDDSLMSTTPGSSGQFTLDQLMEVAGLSVAMATNDFYESTMTSSSSKRICIVCGPGNNGGDGLVAARHLTHFGYNVTVIAPSNIPNPSKPPYFPHLIQQCLDFDIPIHTTIIESMTTCSSASSIEQARSYFSQFDVIVDAMFGFSFKGPAREPYLTFIQAMAQSNDHPIVPVISIDIPSGWDVESGDIHNTQFYPHGVISLTVPKICMKQYSTDNHHYVGLRFIPPTIARQFNIVLPKYPSTDLIVKLTPQSK